MKELIMQALNEAKIKLEELVPLTKKITQSVSIVDMSVLDLMRYIKDNNIPDSAYFDGRDNWDGAWDDILLCWDIKVPTTEKDKEDFRSRMFNDIAWKLVYNSLTNNGYKRVGFSTSKLKDFDDTTVYDMYMSEDFDRLVKYYSLPFVKI